MLWAESLPLRDVWADNFELQEINIWHLLGSAERPPPPLSAQVVFIVRLNAVYQSVMREEETDSTDKDRKLDFKMVFLLELFPWFIYV